MWVSASGAESWACQVMGLLAACRVEGAQCSEAQMGASPGACLGVLDKAQTGRKHRPPPPPSRHECSPELLHLELRVRKVRTVMLRHQYLLGGSMRGPSSGRSHLRQAGVPDFE